MLQGSSDLMMKETPEPQQKDHTLTNYDIIRLAPRPVSHKRKAKPRPSLEERVQALEQEIVARKKAEELLTIAVRALVSKEAFENLQGTVEKSQEQHGKLFDVLNNHNIFTNERLVDIQNQIIEIDGKTVGLQTEMRQRFDAVDTRLDQPQVILAQILERLPEKPQQ